MKARPSLFIRIAPLVAVLAVAIACAKPPNDAQITSDIQSRMGADSGLQNKQLAVQAANGTVTLSGTVDSDAQREAAAKYAAAEPGVKQVINNLQVTPMAAAAEPAPAPSPEPEAAPVKSSRPSRPSPASKAVHRRSTSQDQMSQPAPAEQSAASTPAQAPMAAPQTASAPPPPPEPRKVTVPSGTALPVRLIDAIDSATAQTGDTFHATLDAPVAVDGDVVIPAHYDVEGHVVNAQASGKFAGRALLTLQLDRIKVGDRYYNIQTDQFSQQTGSRGKNTAAKVGGGAVAGAILGGIFGGGKGAAIGSVAGAGAGGGVQAASKKPDIKLSSEKVLTFTLQAPVTVTPTTKPAREGTRLDTNSAQ
jgi:outer membrane biosynthesis protein TonB